MGPKERAISSREQQAPQKRKDSSQPGRNPGKQGNGDNSQGGRAAKRVKVFDARRIQSQPAAAAQNNGELDLQAFLSSREFEIKALEANMCNSKAVSARRAFQVVPRDMRRRTASHNAKRLPKRLRRRARHEMQVDNTPTVDSRRRKPRTTKARIRAETAKRLGILAKRKRNRQLKDAADKAAAGDAMVVDSYVQSRPARPKVKKNTLLDPPKKRSKFAKRQREKVWLPTHIWHTKRARMTEPTDPLWNFSIPLTPTEKVYRPTHRASTIKGAMCWDTSYTSTIRLHGNPDHLDLLIGLDMCRDGKAMQKKVRDGARAMTQLWRVGNKKGSILPGEGSLQTVATVIYNPEAETAAVSGPGENGSVKSSRMLLIRVHPASFQQVWDELLRQIKLHSLHVTLQDLRWEIGSIEIAGPGCTESLKGILRPSKKKGKPRESIDFTDLNAKTFSELPAGTNPASLPKNVILSFNIEDPRLHYPPKTYHDPPSETGDIGLEFANTLAHWPADAGLKPSPLFDDEARRRAAELPSLSSLNRRKAARVPGKELEPIPADPPIPIILVASRGDITGSGTHGSWTLMAPWKCILPIWHSLVHYPLSTGGNPRFGGLNELRQVTYEQGLPWFPGDYPGTLAGLEWEFRERERREREWKRRPKSKRPVWESLDLGAGRKGEIGSGFACDWELLFGMPPVERVEAKLLPENDKKTAEGQSEGKGVAFDSHPLRDMCHFPKWSFDTSLSKHDQDLASLCGVPTVSTVRITMLGRGVPSPCARIYRLPTRDRTAVQSTQAEVPATIPPSMPGALPSDLRDQWLSLVPQPSQQKGTPRHRTSRRPPQPKAMPKDADLQTRKRLMAQSFLTTELPYPRPKGNETDMGGYPLVPGEEDLMGFVTTGEVNLSLGRGFAIGHIAAKKALEAADPRNLTRPKSKIEARLCIVRNVGESVGWLAQWELLELC